MTEKDARNEILKARRCECGRMVDSHRRDDRDYTPKEWLEANDDEESPCLLTQMEASRSATRRTQSDLAAYRAAVRAETLREVRGVVEGIRIEEETWSWEAGHNAAISSTLAALDALAHPEGTDK